MRTTSMSRGTLRGLAGTAAVGLVAASIFVAAPANAVETATYTVPGLQDAFVVPANVHSIKYTVVGGKGGDGDGPHGGAGGLAATVSGNFAVAPGDSLTLWVAGAGQDGGGTGDAPGDGGIGFVEGGDGGWGGTFVFTVGDSTVDLSASRPGAGGGGSSAVLLNSNVVVSAAGGGGGGGRGMDDIVFDACIGGFGGDAGQAGGPSAGGANAPYAKCPTATGGSAGTGSQDPGGDAADVPQQVLAYVNVGGAGGGGAGDGGAGNTNLNPNALFTPAAGGGGGAGGASFQDLTVSPDSVVTIDELAPEATGDGSITLEWVVTLPATGPVNVPIFAGGALLLLVLGGTLFVLRRRSEVV